MQQVKERDYGAANIVISILTLGSWLMMIGGITLFFVGLDEGPRGLGIMVIFGGLGIFISGFLSLAFCQTARAHIHNAEMTWEILVMAREEREERRRPS